MSLKYQGNLDGKQVAVSVSETGFEYEDLKSTQTSSVLLDKIVTVFPISNEGNEDSQISILFIEQSASDNSDIRLKCLEVRGLQDALWHRTMTVLPPYLRIPPSNTSNIHVVVSTHSGTHGALRFFDNALRPLLSKMGIEGYQHYETQSAETIIELSRAIFLPKAQAGVRQTIILLSGDGGLVDIIKVLSGMGHSSNCDMGVFVAPYVSLIPMGTGNATANSTGLAGDATWGLSTLLHGRPQRLPLFRVSLSPGSAYVIDEGRRKKPILESTETNGAAEVYGAVVVSWGMHASLVAESDTTEYRKFGAERFQMAAKELLYPSDGSQTHQYQGGLTLIKKGLPGAEGVVAVDRMKHMYVLVTLMSQLEKGFTISPSSTPLDGQLRVVHFGPLDPDVAMGLMMKAYDGGKHVNDNLVGYEAVEGVRIEFQEEDDKWRRVCVDGKILVIEKGGWLEVRASSENLLDLIIL
ncbi:hypothetical protein LOZ53_003778 [Ophidiomyces ophidiicola]|nr:hypothetical protein LOZ54_003270 [Ophidiomyces ophidiicola]KAI1989005.1 hypothetical protein LOZ53_003778 [Ophidiomyces ophidiicola]KAI2003561.1 hypothetical protein LOZ51_000641 [Ophidiomyces ophidiicola]